jgi:hypothetical protein
MTRMAPSEADQQHPSADAIPGHLRQLTAGFNGAIDGEATEVTAATPEYRQHPQSEEALVPAEAAVGGLAVHAAGSELSHTSEADNAPTPLTSKEIANITFESFRHSQGMESSVHKRLVRYAAKYERERLTPEAVHDSFQLTRQRAFRFTGLAKAEGAPKAHRDDSQRKISSRFEKDIALTEGVWNEVLAEKPMTREEFDKYWWSGEQVILEDLIGRDFSYLVGRGERPRARDEGKESSPTGKYLSHMVYYGMLGNSTGVEAYDHLYDRLTERLHEMKGYKFYVCLNPARTPTDTWLEAHMHTVVRKAAAVHLEHYPDDWDKLSDAWKQYLSGETHPAPTE